LLHFISLRSLFDDQLLQLAQQVHGSLAVDGVSLQVFNDIVLHLADKILKESMVPTKQSLNDHWVYQCDLSSGPGSTKGKEIPSVWLCSDTKAFETDLGVVGTSVRPASSDADQQSHSSYFVEADDVLSAIQKLVPGNLCSLCVAQANGSTSENGIVNMSTRILIPGIYFIISVLV
jgi:hypothetical protein